MNDPVDLNDRLDEGSPASLAHGAICACIVALEENGLDVSIVARHAANPVTRAFTLEHPEIIREELIDALKIAAEMIVPGDGRLISEALLPDQGTDAQLAAAQHATGMTDDGVTQLIVLSFILTNGQLLAVDMVDLEQTRNFAHSILKQVDAAERHVRGEKCYPGEGF